MRNDIHRPSAIIPADYDFVALGYQKIESLDDCAALQENRAILDAHMKRTNGTYSRHEHGGNCYVCGASCIYTAIFHHRATNVYIRTGMDCASKLEMGDESTFKRFREAVKAAEMHKAGKLKAQGILSELGLTEAWTIATGEYVNEYEESTIRDIVGKLIKYGCLSDAQVNFTRKLLGQIANRAELRAQREAEKKAAQPAPIGRKQVTAEVISVKVQDTIYGGRVVMTVKALDGGWLAWGSCTEGDIVKGSVITFKATFEPSDKDEKFAFFKRPKVMDVKNPETIAEQVQREREERYPVVNEANAQEVIDWQEARIKELTAGQ